MNTEREMGLREGRNGHEKNSEREFQSSKNCRNEGREKEVSVEEVRKHG